MSVYVLVQSSLEKDFILFRMTHGNKINWRFPFFLAQFSLPLCLIGPYPLIFFKFVYKIEICMFMHACVYVLFSINDHFSPIVFLLFKVTHVPMQIHFLMAQQVMDFHHRAFVLIYPSCYYYQLMEFLKIHTQHRWLSQ